MTITASITSVGPVRASELQLSARNDVARRFDRETRSVPVEIEGSADAKRRPASDDDRATSVPLPQRRVIDIAV